MKMEWNNRSEVWAHFIMAVCGGFFGGYAIFGRMAVFGSAQTANLIELVGDILGRNLTDASLRLGALLLYAAAMMIFVVLREKTPLNLKYLAIAVDATAAAATAAMPEQMDPVLALYPVFFAMSFQWCVFKGAEGYACSTIFSTNNLKQTVLSFTEYFMVREDDEEERTKKLKKGRFFGETILFFHASVAAAFLALHVMGLSAVWLVMLPLFACLVITELQEGVIREWMARLVMKKKKIA